MRFSSPVRPLRTMFLVTVACVLGACSGGGQQAAPPGGAGLHPAAQSQARVAMDEGRGGGGDRDDGGGSVVYNSVPKPLHGIPSQGFECCQVLEFGDGMNLTHTGRLNAVSIVMDSWGCQTGHGNLPNCMTTPGATFPVPITMNVYAVKSTGTHVGPLLATRTQTFNIPYRPSADNVRCTGASVGEFFSAVDNACIHGLPNLITFDFPQPRVQLPAQIIVSVAYNTSTGGYHPIGTSTACFTSSGGCGYDSLNVGAGGNGGPIGSALDPNGAFVNYSVATNYCDPTQGTGFRLDTGPNCWAGYHPQIRVTVAGGGDGDDRDRDHGDHGD
jgi:hypothetical protein